MVMRQNLITTFFQMFRRDKKLIILTEFELFNLYEVFDTLCNVMLNTQICKKKRLSILAIIEKS